MGAAVFSDVEGTLFDGSLPGLFLQVGQQIGLYSPWQRLRIGLLLRVTRRLPLKVRRQAYGLGVMIAIGNQREAVVQHWIDEAMPLVLAQLKPGPLAHLRQHQAAGLPLVLVSGGFHDAIVRLGQELGGRGEGTKVQQRDGRYLARVDGATCQGKAKAARAQTIIAQEGYDAAQSYAYGDTVSDIPFLALFGHPHVVDPNPELAAEAQRRGWAVVKGGE